MRPGGMYDYIVGGGHTHAAVVIISGKPTNTVAADARV
jgi:hypothetical protein